MTYQAKRAFHDVLGEVRDMGADLVVAAGINHESVGLPCAQMNVANRDSATTSLQPADLCSVPELHEPW